MPLHVDRHDRVALLTLDEPERRNALTAPLVAEIVATMDELDADPGVGAVVVTGAPPAFCSGADVQALAAMASGSEEPGDVRAIYAGFLRILDSPLPTVAMRTTEAPRTSVPRWMRTKPCGAQACSSAARVVRWRRVRPRHAIST